MLSMVDKTKFIKWLRDEMARQNITQAELARRSGVPRGTISMLIGEERGPGTDLLISLARGLKLPVEELFRAAELLGPLPKDDARIERWRELLSYLSDQKADELEALGRVMIDLNLRQVELRKKRNNKRNGKND